MMIFYSLSHYVTRRRSALVIGILTMTVAGPVLAGAPGGRTVWDQVYTEAQAGRGTQVFIENCAMCHAVNMQGGPGGATALVGPEFQFLWKDQSVGALFVILRAKMPPGEAGSLSDQEYADIVAAILQGNGFPAGADQELPGDGTLTGDIRITWDKPDNNNRDTQANISK